MSDRGWYLDEDDEGAVVIFPVDSPGAVFLDRDTLISMLHAIDSLEVEDA